MNSDARDSSVTPPVTGVPSPVLSIPEARDGFFGYPEEKTQQHVCLPFLLEQGVS
jgi:hypothetical protein